MSDRIELNDQQLEDVTGGALTWESDGTVHVRGKTNVVYRYTDYYKCAAWLIENWGGVQKEACLEAMAAAGLITKVSDN